MKFIGLYNPMLLLGGGIFYGMLAVLFVAFAVSGIFQKLMHPHDDHRFINKAQIGLAAPAAAVDLTTGRGRYHTK